MEREEYIEELSKELNVLPKTDLDIFNAFSPFVKDVDTLKNIIADGMLQYEYAKYLKDIKNTRFESSLLSLVKLFRNSLAVDSTLAIEIFVQDFSQISKGLQNITQLGYLHDSKKEIERLDLFAKYSFMQLGNILEGTHKCFIQLFYNLINILSEKKIMKKSFGDAVQALVAFEDSFQYLFKDALYGIEISQWRNIANHHSYSLTSDNKIEMTYGRNKKHSITRVQLEEIFIILDTIGYTMKIAHTLIGIDNINALSEKINAKSFIDDDTIIAQVVETSKYYGYQTMKCTNQGGKWMVTVNEEVAIPFNKEKVIAYITTITKFTTPDVVLEIFDCCGHMQISAKIENRKLLIQRMPT